MIKRDYILILTLLVVILAISITIASIIPQDSQTAINNSSKNHEILANESIGSVEVIRNIGNPGGEKIAGVFSTSFADGTLTEVSGGSTIIIDYDNRQLHSSSISD